MAVGKAIQVVLAVMITIILFVIGFAIFNMEQIKAVQESNKQKLRVDIFKGIKDFALAHNEAYNTNDESSPLYKALSLSVNQQAGAEFTYNFWLYVNDYNTVFGAQGTNTGVEVKTDGGIQATDMILLLRGDKTLYSYKDICNSSTKQDVMVKCPLIKMADGGNILVVEFNTVSGPDAVHEQARNTCSDISQDRIAMNKHRLAVSDLRSKTNLTDKWFMVTVIIQDTNPKDPLPIRNKARCRIFINGVMELDRYVDGALASNDTHPQVVLQNKGNLYVNQQITGLSGSATTTKQVTSSDTQKLYMADLAYFNYALSPDEIRSMFSAQFSKTYAPSISEQAADATLTTIWTNVSLAPDKKQLVAY
jgi:hypothetical protein